ncbi:MAG: hypothetical protein R3E39_28010 [Anaerolineae bacterium]
MVRIVAEEVRSPNDQSSPPDDPRWLDEFEELANRQLEDGSSCDQVHPIIERWFANLMQGEPPTSRASIQQAMSPFQPRFLNLLPMI